MYNFKLKIRLLLGSLTFSVGLKQIISLHPQPIWMNIHGNHGLFISFETIQVNILVLTGFTRMLAVPLPWDLSVDQFSMAPKAAGVVRGAKAAG